MTAMASIWSLFFQAGIPNVSSEKAHTLGVNCPGGRRVDLKEHAPNRTTVKAARRGGAGRGGARSAQLAVG